MKLASFPDALLPELLGMRLSCNCMSEEQYKYTSIVAIYIVIMYAINVEGD